MLERLVVVAVIAERDGRFLVARRLRGTHLAGCWEFPGGKVHDDETNEAALEREIDEELRRRVEAGPAGGHAVDASRVS